MPNLQVAVVAAGLLAFSSSAFAHGGQYRGPTPAGPRDTVPIPASWQAFWECNREPLVRVPTIPAPAPDTGGDNYFLGARRAGADLPAHAVTPIDRRDQIVPALLAAIASDRHRDLQTACLMALAKLGLDGDGVPLLPVLRERLARDDQEVRETAALALGLAGRAEALPLLQTLLEGKQAARELLGGAVVSERVRTFAVYGMALLARRLDESAMQQAIYQQLWALLQSREATSRDLRVAAVLGIGALRPNDSPGSKRLAWIAAEDLLGWLQKDLGAGEAFVQAQAPLAMARLLGRGDSTAHQRCKREFAAMLTASSRRHNPLLQSAAIALGAMTLPAEVSPEDAPHSAALRLAYERGYEEHVRMFAVMGLGRIGGTANRKWLLEAYAKGNKMVEKPWLAVALGLLAFDRAIAGAPDVEIGELLLKELEDASLEDLRAPLAIAVGLTRHRPGAVRLRAVLQARLDNERIAGYLCTSLGLLGDPGSVPLLAEILQASKRRPWVLQAAAMALHQLGDAEVTSRLVAMMANSDGAATLVAIASAIGRIGDRRAIAPLVVQLANKDQPTLTRAFTAAALGWVGDKERTAWNEIFAVDANFATGIDTLSNGTTGILDIL